jgi:hypothetical protein
MTEEVFDKWLGQDLRNRLYTITRYVNRFWEEGQHLHFTFHGLKHSRQIQKRLAELIQEWNKDNPLSEDEIFVLFAAALLYDIGMQCTDLLPELDFDWQHKPLSQSQLLQIREKKHLLTYRMIFQSVNHKPGYRLQLGLLEADDYTRCIAEVCRGCSDDPPDTTTDVVGTRNGPIRVPLLVGLLRLADQLYIDRERVNLDLLEAAPLPLPQKLRWWLYHYTRVLPIEKGQISFRYMLPTPVYNEFLGQIRTVIEQPFYHTTNPVIQALWDNLRLVPHRDATVEFSPPHIISRQMHADLMRELSIVQVNKEYENRIQQRQRHERRCLLMLDYENFLIQLGLEGYFPTLDDLNMILPDLLIEAREQYPGHLIDGTVVGHWERPYLRSAAAIFQDMYTLVTLKEQEQSATVLAQELDSLCQQATLPHQVLLVAPPRSLAVTARQLQETGQAIAAWITNTQDARIFPALIHHTRPLTKVLNFPARKPFLQEDLKAAIDSSILCLDDDLLNNKQAFSFEAMNTLLSQIEGIHGKDEWWQLYLLHQRIITLEHNEEQSRLKLNTEHSAVSTIIKKRNALISLFQPDNRKVRQDTLLRMMQQQEAFQDDRDYIPRFLSILRERNVIFVDLQPGRDEEFPLWQLNSAHTAVMRLNADRYLPFFLLGLDHALAQHGYQSLLEDTLNRHLKNYMENSAMIQATYQVALDRGWVRKREQRNRQGKLQMAVEPVYSLPEVQEIVLNCVLLLKTLYSKTRDKSIQRNELWSVMSRISSFTLKPDEFDNWLTLFHSNKLVDINKDEEKMSRDAISLCRNTPLVQHLLGRLNMCWIVLTMRTLHAKSAETAQPMDAVVQRAASFISRGDHTLATWSIEQAKLVKLILPIPQQNSTQPALFLNHHSIVRRLDGREKAISQALVALVRSLSRPQEHEGWVPRHVVIQRMRNNPLFGSTDEEFNYWVNNATHRKPEVLQEKPDPARRVQTLLQIKSR